MPRTPARQQPKTRRRTSPVGARSSPRSSRPAIRASRTNLTPEERALLPDPDWVTKDDADFVIGLRGELQGKPIPLARVLRRYGYRVEG